MPDASARPVPVNHPAYPAVNVDVAMELGLRSSEYDLAVERLGRVPTYLELNMFAVEWSEHCAYKYSRNTLRAFGAFKKAQDANALEGAGVVPLGNTGQGIVFKMESHNHPSYVEPFNGSATGVGGIIRDIISMGARPIAVLDSLRFGDIDGDTDIHIKNRFLFSGVVHGISSYGNCLGVPTVGGEITFHPCYNTNPLVNAMAIGVVELGNVAKSAAKGVGNPVVFFGSATGRDGIHGATFASVEISEASEAKRPNVQVGDPFFGKLLIEATLEILATGHIRGIQDFGAAGFTCASVEMSSKGNVGMDINADVIPQRETGMTAAEIFTSESQERMLCVVEKGHEDEIIAICDKWGLSSAVIGTVTETQNVVIHHHGRIEADVPAQLLTDGCPTYTLDAAEPDYIAVCKAFDTDALPEPADYSASLLKLLGTPTIASKRWVFETYDHQVQTQTEVVPGAGDAAVLAVRAAGGRRIAATTDCNPRWCYLDPHLGSQHAVAEASRNLSCVGAVPVATTDNLNMPNPEKETGFWQFSQCVYGLAEACDFFGAPVVSGNVSFYNESPTGPIHPTPTIGMVGVFPEGVEPVGLAFQSVNDLVYVLRPVGSDDERGIGGSQYLYVQHGLETGALPKLDMSAELAVQAATRELIAKGIIKSAHDCSDGGLLVNVCESALAGNTGVELRLSVTDFGDQPWSAICFGEAASRVVVSVREGGDEQTALLDIAEAHGIEAVFIGQVTSRNKIELPGVLEVSLDAAKDAFEGTIPRIMAH